MLNLIPERLSPTSAPDVPRTGVDIDAQLWAMHREMVQLAQENRVAFVKALTELASMLLSTLK
jgi:hypothetical protein